MNILALGWDRTRLELKQYVREKESVFFSFLFPILLLVLFATIFAEEIDGAGAGMSAAHWFLPGMIAAGVLLTSFQTMAMSVAVERDDGTLKRLRSTPLPPVAFFLGKVGLVAISSIAQVAVLLAVARWAYDVPLPTGTRWLTFAWVFALGVIGGVVLGLAYSSLGTARSIAAVVIAPLLVLQFISGVYFTFSSLPGWLQQIAALFPLKWIAQGMREVFYPDHLATLEMAGTWELGRTALVLGGWAALGLVLCLTTFSWYRRGTT